MESETHQETFGGYLQSFRTKRELAVETMAAATKISAHCIRAIEENAHDRLPPPAYVKSFIRTYAGAVGANADLAVNLYKSDLEQREAAKQQLKRRAGRWILRRILMGAVVIVSILLLMRYTDILPEDAPPQRPTAPETDAPPVSPPETAESAAAPGRATAAPTREPLKLKIVAVEQTWLKVIVDGQNARSYRLKPEDRLELEGSDNFNLMIGNATGLKIYLNDRPVKIFGSSNQVVSLKIP